MVYRVNSVWLFPNFRHMNLLIFRFNKLHFCQLIYTFLYTVVRHNFLPIRHILTKWVIRNDLQRLLLLYTIYINIYSSIIYYIPNKQ